MEWLKNLTASKSSTDLETEKAKELAALSKSYDEKIAAASAKEAPPAVGTTGAVGARRRKTRRGGKRRKSRKSRK